VTLDEFAAAVDALADRAEADLATECAEASGRAFLAVMQAVTPKRSGHLAASETLDAVIGSGPTAVAVVGAHARYAEFRNKGGTISVRNAKVLTDGVAFFGKSVTQKGSHYLERAEAAAPAEIARVCQTTLERFLTL
jgi:Bacteriophage HK97-gp10, putative tail-component